MTEKLYTEVTMRVLFDFRGEGDDLAAYDNLLTALAELDEEGYFPTGADIRTNFKVRG